MSEQHSNMKKKYALSGGSLAKHLGLKSSRFQEQQMSSNAQKEIDNIKIKDRDYMKLQEWSAREHFKNQSIKQLWQFDKKLDKIDKVDASELSSKQFIEKYEKPHIPVIIKNSTKDWNVDKYWSFEELYRRYSDVSYKIAEDNDGKKLRIPLKYFLEYLVYNQDDSPLYLFESAIEDLKNGGADMIKKFTVHKYFQEDLFSLTGEKRRPPYRWLLVGPTRSGTTIHIDPLQTSAWNTSLQGHKLWVLFPPHIPKSIVKGKGLVVRGQVKNEDVDEAIDWFLYVLPKIIEKEGINNLEIIQTIQGPGDTIFVPGGWWHAVINLDNTIAITQNFMNRINFERVWSSVKIERPKFSQKLLQAFKLQAPDLYNRAKKFDQDQNEFVERITQTEICSSAKTSPRPIKVVVVNGQPKKIRKLSQDTIEKSSSSSSSSDNSSSDSSDSES